MKRLIAFICAAVLLVLCFSGCRKADTTNSTSSAISSASESGKTVDSSFATESDKTSSEAKQNSANTSSAEQNSGSAVKEENKQTTGSTGGNSGIELPRIPL